MAFVKLDCGMLDSTLWVDRAARELFITALLMAEPRELKAPEPQIKVDCLDQTGFMVPPGWYGFVPAAGTGIIRRCGEMTMECGIEALRRLGDPEQDSRTPDHDGRRMVRVDGGYLILNYDKYRQKDYSAAERSKRYREKKKASRVANVTSRVTDRSVTQAEGEGEAYNPTNNPSPVADAPKRGRFVKPTLADVTEAMVGIVNHEREAQAFVDHFESNGWRVGGKTPMKDWRAAVRTWKRRREDEATKPTLTFKEAARAREAEIHTKPHPKYGW